MSMKIYKLFARDDWARFRKAGVFDGSADDRRGGYLHFSTGSQLRETAARYYAEQSGVVLAECDSDDLGDALRWEPSRGGQLFPHLYRPLETADVRISWPLPYEHGSHRFPAGVDLG
jgi:uncharacterized protein (DUF952 family)